MTLDGLIYFRKYKGRTVIFQCVRLERDNRITLQRLGDLRNGQISWSNYVQKLEAGERSKVENAVNEKFHELEADPHKRTLELSLLFTKFMDELKAILQESHSPEDASFILAGMLDVRTEISREMEKNHSFRDKTTIANTPPSRGPSNPAKKEQPLEPAEN